MPILLLLAHVRQPAKTREVVEKGVEIGFRHIKNWNVTDILRGAARANQVAQRPDGWLLLDPGVAALKATGIHLQARPVHKPPTAFFRASYFKDAPVHRRVVRQINGSYDHGLYDCCAVMCRRLGETLIIEVYETQNRANEIRSADGNFQMLNGLLGVLNKDKTINLGRNAKRGLEALKDLGDKAAHNRRFNATQPDIDSIRPDLRTAAEELLHVAKLVT